MQVRLTSGTSPSFYTKRLVAHHRLVFKDRKSSSVFNSALVQALVECKYWELTCKESPCSFCTACSRYNCKESIEELFKFPRSMSMFCIETWSIDSPSRHKRIREETKCHLFLNSSFYNPSRKSPQNIKESCKSSVMIVVYVKHVLWNTYKMSEINC